MSFHNRNRGRKHREKHINYDDDADDEENYLLVPHEEPVVLQVVNEKQEITVPAATENYKQTTVDSIYNYLYVILLLLLLVIGALVFILVTQNNERVHIIRNNNTAIEDIQLINSILLGYQQSFTTVNLTTLTGYFSTVYSINVVVEQLIGSTVNITLLLQVQGPTVLYGLLTVNNNTVLNGNLSVTGIVNIPNSLFVNNLQVQQQAQVNGNLTVLLDIIVGKSIYFTDPYLLTASPQALVFMLFDQYTTQQTPLLYLGSNGFVGINTTTPQSLLDVSSGTITALNANITSMTTVNNINILGALTSATGDLQITGNITLTQITSNVTITQSLTVDGDIKGTGNLAVTGQVSAAAITASTAVINGLVEANSLDITGASVFGMGITTHGITNLGVNPVTTTNFQSVTGTFTGLLTTAGIADSSFITTSFLVGTNTFATNLQVTNYTSLGGNTYINNLVVTNETNLLSFTATAATIQSLTVVNLVDTSSLVTNLLTVNDNAVFMGNVTINGTLTIFGSTIQNSVIYVNSSITIAGNAQTLGSSHIFGNAQVDGNVIVGLTLFTPLLTVYNLSSENTINSNTINNNGTITTINSIIRNNENIMGSLTVQLVADITTILSTNITNAQVLVTTTLIVLQSAEFQSGLVAVGNITSSIINNSGLLQSNSLSITQTSSFLGTSTFAASIVSNGGITDTVGITSPSITATQGQFTFLNAQNSYIYNATANSAFVANNVTVGGFINCGQTVIIQGNLIVNGFINTTNVFENVVTQNVTNGIFLNLNVNQNLVVQGTSTFVGTIFVIGDTVRNGTNTFFGATNFYGPSFFYGDINVIGNTIRNGTNTFYGATYFNGFAYHYDNVTLVNAQILSNGIVDNNYVITPILTATTINVNQNIYCLGNTTTNFLFSNGIINGGIMQSANVNVVSTLNVFGTSNLSGVKNTGSFETTSLTVDNNAQINGNLAVQNITANTLGATTITLSNILTTVYLGALNATIQEINSNIINNANTINTLNLVATGTMSVVGNINNQGNILTTAITSTTILNSASVTTSTLSVTSTSTLTGLETANGGITVNNIILTANAGITSTTGAFSSLLTTNGISNTGNITTSQNLEVFQNTYLLGTLTVSGITAVQNLDIFGTSTHNGAASFLQNITASTDIIMTNSLPLFIAPNGNLTIISPWVIHYQHVGENSPQTFMGSATANAGYGTAGTTWFNRQMIIAAIISAAGVVTQQTGGISAVSVGGASSNQFTITISPAFDAPPVVTCSAVSTVAGSSTLAVCDVISASTSSVVVNTGDPNGGVLLAFPFHIIIVGGH